MEDPDYLARMHTKFDRIDALMGDIQAILRRIEPMIVEVYDHMQRVVAEAEGRKQ
jgi:hypothetical protein